MKWDTDYTFYGMLFAAILAFTALFLFAPAGDARFAGWVVRKGCEAEAAEFYERVRGTPGDRRAAMLAAFGAPPPVEAAR